MRMKKIVFSFILGLSIYGVVSLLFPSPVQANCQMLNVNYEDFLRCVNNGQAPGGTTVSWLYRLSSAEYQEMQKIINYNNFRPPGQRYNFDVRLYIPGKLPTNNQVDAFLSSLASLNSATQINARLVNEPNNLINENYYQKYSPEFIAKRVYDIYEHAHKTLTNLQPGTRITLGMTLDHWAPTLADGRTISAADFIKMMNTATGVDVMNNFYQWDVIWMLNAYMEDNNPTHIGNFRLATLREDLHRLLGVPYDMRIAIFEIGAIRTGADRGVTYDINTLVYLFTQTTLLQDLEKAGVEWFTIFIQSPEDPTGTYSFLKILPSVFNAFANFFSGKDPFLIATLTEEEFQQLLELIQVLIDAGLIVACPEGGFAATLKECEEGVAPGFPGYSYYTSSLLCTPQSTGARDSRPDACDPCNATSYSAQSCATSFTINDTVTYEKKDGTPEEPHCLEEEWSGTVIIDASNTTIPFVGKKREADIESREDEQKYLADYFEGTHEYYRTYDHQVTIPQGIPVFGGKDFTLFNGINSTLIPNYAGVLRKLTPMGYQNMLKTEIINRAQKTVASGGVLEPGGIHDYKITYEPRLCWDFSFWTEATITAANEIAHYFDVPVNLSGMLDFSHYCLYAFAGDEKKLDLIEAILNQYNTTVLGKFLAINTEGKIDGVEKNLTEIASHLPPNPDDEDYIKKWREWKDSDYGKVWEAVPLVSRDDTPGEIAPYFGFKAEDQPKYIPIQIEKVPHLARLFEETLELNELLLPQGTAGAPKFAQEGENKPLLASAKNNLLNQGTEIESCSSGNNDPNTGKVLGEKTIIAQSDEDTVPATASIVLVQQGCIVKPFIQVNMCPAGARQEGRPYHATIRCGSPWDGSNPNIFSQVDPGLWLGDYSCPGVDLSNMDVGDSVSLSVLIEKIDAEHCLPIDSINLNCTITKNGPECGQFESDCTSGPPLEELCGLAGPMPISDCFREAIKDNNPNDRICGEPTECEDYQAIEFPLTAVDAFQNLQYLECGFDLYDCHPNRLGVKVCKDHCHDKITQEVNRRFGINLIHPYLNEIWNLSTNNETFGIFNLFRPSQIPPFEDIDASSEISYSYVDTSDPLGGNATPESGEFYFNHLGGIQKAKEWVTTKVLMPFVEQ